MISEGDIIFKRSQDSGLCSAADSDEAFSKEKPYVWAEFIKQGARQDRPHTRLP